MNEEERRKFERDGFIILRNIIAEKDCKDLLSKTIKPILKKDKKFFIKKKYKKQGDLIASNNGEPIRGINSSWPSFFNNNKLLSVIDEIHGKKWNWNCYKKPSLGWIHLRYPFSRKKRWKIPKNGWHIDAITNKNKTSWNKGITILPIINKIRNNGGGTALFTGSHKLINYWIMNLQNKIDLWDFIKCQTQRELERNNPSIIEATGNPGDILIMHPHLIHTWSNVYYKHGLRVTFNISTDIQ